MTIEEQWERARAIGESENSAAAVPALKALLDESPDHVGANYALGTILLEQRNSEGVEYLEKIMQASNELAAQACGLISGFYLEQNNSEKAQEYRARAQDYYKRAQEFQQQVLTISASDQFAPHDLEESRIKELQNQLAKVRGLESAYLVRKLVEGSIPEFYILASTAKYTWREGRSEKHVNPLFDELARIDLPSPVILLPLDGQHPSLVDRISRIAEAQVFATPEA